jgi:predicted MFS family arabinose efflux permease
MGIGTSLVLIAIGAILSYAVEFDVSGLDINTVGVILMVLGVAGLLISLLYMAFWADRTRPRGTVVEEGAVPPAGAVRREERVERY